MPLPALPDVLTYSHWNRNKKKGTPSTGLGSKLKEIEKRYAALPANAVDKLSKFKNPNELIEAKAIVEGERNRSIKAFRTYVLGFGNDATKQAAEAKRAKLFPKTSRELIEKMATQAGYTPKAIEDYIGLELQKAEKRLREGPKLVQSTLDGAVTAVREAEQKLGKIDGMLSKAETAIEKLDKALRNGGTMADADRKAARSKLQQLGTQCGGLAEAASKIGDSLRKDARVTAVRGGGAKRLCTDNGVDFSRFSSAFDANMRKFGEFEDTLRDLESRAEDGSAACDTAILLTTEGIDASKKNALALAALHKTLQKGIARVNASVGNKYLDAAEIRRIQDRDWASLGEPALGSIATQISVLTKRRETVNRAMIALVGLITRELKKIPADYRGGDGKKLADQIATELKAFNERIQNEKRQFGEGIEAYEEGVRKIRAMAT